MIINLAHGLPASGKTTYLKSLEGEYIDLDNKSVAYSKQVIESLKDGTYNVDLMLIRPERFIRYLENIYEGCIINVKVLNIPREVCLQRDSLRPKGRQSTHLIKTMRINL